MPQALRKKRERIIPARADGPEKEVKLNWILNTKWIFVALFCRNRELLKVSGKKTDVIKNMFHENQSESDVKSRSFGRHQKKSIMTIQGKTTNP